jgi:hypothetical protein
MNIKGVNTSPILPIDQKQKVEGKTRAQSSADRDADGRRQQQEPEQKRHLNPQEFDDALKVLEAFPGLKANNLRIKVEVKDDCRVILILDPLGKVVRRLSEQQLWSATRDKDRQTGAILDKAM